MRACLPVLFVAISGCALYFPGDDDPDPCDFGGGGNGGLAEPAVGQRNPQTGQCEYFGGGGPFPCDPECGPCPETGAADQAQPSWGYCESECSFLDEQTCRDTTGCRAIYIDGDPPTFSECWSTDMTGPIQGGGCDGLDAYTCSRHDDCVAVHANTCGGNFEEPDPACVPGEFVSCGDEGPGVGNCYEAVTCADPEPMCPVDTLPGVADGCYTGFCIPLAECEPEPACDTLDESTCISRVDCGPLFRGSDCTCDANGCTCATLDFTGCEPLPAP